MKFIVHAVFWLAVYFVLILSPLLVLKFGTVPQGSGFWWDLSMALGFAGLAMMGVQFVLTARFKRLSAPYGIDIIYFFHRYLAITALFIILLHLAIIHVTAPGVLKPVNPLAAPAYMTAGRIALLLFSILIIMSLCRKLFGLVYERWRLWHVLLAVTAFSLSVAHVVGVGHYIKAPLKELLWTAYSLFWVLLILYVRLIRPWRLKHRPYRVIGVRPERGHVHTLTLAPDGHAGMRFAPGQFAWLSLASPFSLQEHPFSFSSTPEPSGKVEFTIKELGDFTRTIKYVVPGTVAYVDGPYGNFTLERFTAAPALVFIAGGVGIAPVMSMLRSLAERHDARPLLLLYGNEDRERITFYEALENLKQDVNLEIVHVLKQPPAGWTGETGLINHEILRSHIDERWSQAEFFICGPGAMRIAVEKSLHRLEVPLRRMHSELFELV